MKKSYVNCVCSDKVKVAEKKLEKRKSRNYNKFIDCCIDYR